MESDELPAHPMDINVRGDDQLAVAPYAGGFTQYKIIMQQQHIYNTVNKYLCFLIK